MLSLDRKHILLIITFTGLFPLLFLDKLFLLVPILFFVFVLLVDSKSSIIVLSFVLLISITSGFGETVRLIVQVTVFMLLIMLFLKEFGFEWKNYPKVPSPIIWLVAAIFGVMFFSLLFTKYFVLGLEQVIRSILFFALVYIYYSFLRDRSSIKLLMFAFLTGMVVYLVMLFYEVIRADFDIIHLNQNLLLEDEVRLIHRNAIGAVFSVCILFSLVFLNYSSNWKKQLILIVSILVFGLILTNSRAAILTTLVSSLYIFYNTNIKVFKILVLSILLLVPIYLIDPINETLNLYLRLERIATGRDYILQMVLNIIYNNPLIGFGPAATKLEIYNYLPYMLNSIEATFLSNLTQQGGFGQAHNFYLFLYTDLGLLGFIISLCIPYVYFKMNFRTLKTMDRNDKFSYRLVIGLQASGIFLFIRGLVEWAGIFSYGTIRYDLPFWLLFAVTAFLYQRTFSLKVKFNGSSKRKI